MNNPLLGLTMQTKEIFDKDLRAHDYIEARGLSPQIVAAHQHTCESCRQAEELPRIQRILNGWGMDTILTAALVDL